MTLPAKDSAVRVCVDERLVRFVRGCYTINNG
jgi:hypothetical protein